jgi:hypothetical protein
MNFDRDKVKLPIGRVNFKKFRFSTRKPDFQAKLSPFLDCPLPVLYNWKKRSSKTDGKYGFYLGFFIVSITRRNFYPPFKDVYLFQISDDFLQIISRVDSLDCCNCFSTSTLLNTDMAETLFSAFLFFELLKSV